MEVNKCASSSIIAFKKSTMIFIYLEWYCIPFPVLLSRTMPWLERYTAEGERERE